ncbi:FixH family protein [Alkalihalobacillus macyae]|uniref:FixH family protein n=1 Tax=Guptibacillus hwajinpoensis TaxID=208199 RepID=UPI00273AB7EC|nr:FixH family protein [Alkalihalobacillus macyae]MDP4549505.1 FixH family protein [Alkalihalobacillus macyae]
MRNVSMMIGLVFLLALAACSGVAENSSSNKQMANEASNEQVSDSKNSTEAGDAMESSDEEGEKEDKMSEPALEIAITEESPDEEGDHGDHHAADLDILLDADEMDPTLLTTSVKEEMQALTEANVRFEYWKEGDDQHTYTDAEENDEGMYDGKVEISEPGTYMLKVHVEKGEDLHTHQAFVLDVKEK